MMKKTGSLFRLLACLWVSGPVAAAGEVTLVSDTFDLVCQVEVTWGAAAPEGTPVEYHRDVHRDWSITKPEKLCYRRPSTADNCDSGMTQWKTRWRCADATGSGVTELSLQ